MRDRESLVIRSPEDAVSAVPYLLGFHPDDSLVVVGYGGPHGTCALRSDLPRSLADAKEVAERFAGMLVRNRFEDVLLIGYGPGDLVTPAAETAGVTIARHGLQLREMLRVDDGRWWSYLCGDPECCPPDGTPFDVRTSAVAAQATVAGQVALPCRSELAATVAALTGPVRTAIRRSTTRAEARLAESCPPGPCEAGASELRALAAPVPDIGDEGDLGQLGRSTRWWRSGRRRADHRLNDQRVGDGVPLVQALLARLVADPDAALEELLADPDRVAWLGVLLTHVRVRDEAWVRIEPDRPEPYIILWREVLRRVEPRYAAAPACLLAYAAFLAGDGGLANVALDRAEEADPDYTMAGLLRDVIQAGLPPAAARLRMTPEDLAEAWEGNLPREEDKQPKSRQNRKA